MATAHIKKVIKLGGSLAILLPKQWTKGKVTAGEEMIVVSNGELRIFPVHSKTSLLSDEKGKNQEDQNS
jgi:hypothetical protein